MAPIILQPIAVMKLIFEWTMNIDMSERLSTSPWSNIKKKDTQFYLLSKDTSLR